MIRLTYYFVSILSPNNQYYLPHVNNQTNSPYRISAGTAYAD